MKFIPKSGKLEPPTMLEMYFKQGSKYTGSTYKADASRNQGEMMFMIADYQNKALVVLMGDNEKKYRTVMSMDPALYNQSNQVEKQQEPVDWNNVTEWRGYKNWEKEPSWAILAMVTLLLMRLENQRYGLPGTKYLAWKTSLMPEIWV